MSDSPLKPFSLADVDQRIPDALVDDRVKLFLKILLRRKEASVLEVIEDAAPFRTALTLIPATTYVLVRKLEALRLIEIARVDGSNGGRPRQLYQVSSIGKQCLEEYLRITASLR